MAPHPDPAPVSTARTDLHVRPLATVAEFDACVGLQRATWGEEFRDVVPSILVQIAQKVGGIAAGAFEDGVLQGFVFGLTGVEGGRVVHWSHMLAVREDARDRGIGQRLKEFQREWLRARNVERVYWTFDPLVARNAHLNLERLGAEVTEYVPDMYGRDTGSRLHAGLGTDRFVVVWRLDGGPRRHDPPRDWGRAPCVNGRVPVDESEGVRLVRLEIPEDIQAVRRSDGASAAHWRQTTRAAFQHYLGRGWRVAGFVRDRAAGRCWYLLEAQG